MSSISQSPTKGGVNQQLMDCSIIRSIRKAPAKDKSNSELIFQLAAFKAGATVGNLKFTGFAEVLLKRMCGGSAISIMINGWDAVEAKVLVNVGCEGLFHNILAQCGRGSSTKICPAQPLAWGYNQPTC